VFFGNDSTERFTAGFNIGLPGGSLLMLNYERWMSSGGSNAATCGRNWQPG
jgi:hypothetical protein